MKITKFPSFGKELINLPFRVDRSGRVEVKYYEDGVQAGFPSPADDFMEVKLSLDERYLSHPEATFLIKLVGESMYPTLQEGDILIVRSDMDSQNNNIVIVSVNNTEFAVKRLDLAQNFLIADNENFPDVKVEKGDTILCLGVVKHFIRDL